MEQDVADLSNRRNGDNGENQSHQSAEVRQPGREYADHSVAHQDDRAQEPREENLSGLHLLSILGAYRPALPDPGRPGRQVDQDSGTTDEHSSGDVRESDHRSPTNVCPDVRPTTATDVNDAIGPRYVTRSVTRRRDYAEWSRVREEQRKLATRSDQGLDAALVELSYDSSTTDCSSCDEDDSDSSTSTLGEIPDGSCQTEIRTRIYLCFECKLLSRGKRCNCEYPYWIQEDVFEQVFAHISWESRIEQDQRMVAFFYIMNPELRAKLNSAGRFESGGRGTAPEGIWVVKFSELPLPADLPEWLAALCDAKIARGICPKPGEGMTSEFCADETWGWTHMNLPTQVIMVCLKSQKMGTKLSCIDLVNVCEINDHIFTKVEAADVILGHLRWERRIKENLTSVIVFYDSRARPRPEQALKRAQLGSLVAGGHGVPDGRWHVDLKNLPDSENIIEQLAVAQEDRYLKALENWCKYTLSTIDKIETSEDSFSCKKCGISSGITCECIGRKITATKRVLAKVSRKLSFESLKESRDTQTGSSCAQPESDSEEELSVISRAMAPGIDRFLERTEASFEPSTSGRSFIQSPFPGYVNTEGRAEYLPPQPSRDDCTQCWKKYMSRSDFSCTVHPRESPAYLPSAEAGRNWAAPSHCPNCTDRYGGDKCSLCKYRLQILKARQTIAGGIGDVPPYAGCLECDQEGGERFSLPCNPCYYQRQPPFRPLRLLRSPFKTCVKRLLFGEDCCDCKVRPVCLADMEDLQSKENPVRPSVDYGQTTSSINPPDPESHVERINRLHTEYHRTCLKCKRTLVDMYCSYCQRTDQTSPTRPSDDAPLDLSEIRMNDSYENNGQWQHSVVYSPVQRQNCPDCNCFDLRTQRDPELSPFSPTTQCQNPYHRRSSTPVRSEESSLVLRENYDGNNTLGLVTMELDESLMGETTASERYTTATESFDRFHTVESFGQYEMVENATASTHYVEGQAYVLVENATASTYYIEGQAMGYPATYEAGQYQEQPPLIFQCETSKAHAAEESPTESSSGWTYSCP